MTHGSERTTHPSQRSALHPESILFPSWTSPRVLSPYRGSKRGDLYRCRFPPSNSHPDLDQGTWAQWRFHRSMHCSSTPTPWSRTGALRPWLWCARGLYAWQYCLFRSDWFLHLFISLWSLTKPAVWCGEWFDGHNSPPPPPDAVGARSRIGPYREENATFASTIARGSIHILCHKFGGNWHLNEKVVLGILIGCLQKHSEYMHIIFLSIYIIFFWGGCFDNSEGNNPDFFL